MTRSSKLALVTLFVGLLSFVSTATVSADNLCDAGAYDQCVQVATPDVDSASLVQVYSVARPAAIPSECAFGMGCTTMKLSEANLFLGTVSEDAAPVAASTATSRFIEVNTVMLPNTDASPFYAASDSMRH